MKMKGYSLKHISIDEDRLLCMVNHSFIYSKRRWSSQIMWIFAVESDKDWESKFQCIFHFYYQW